MKYVAEDGRQFLTEEECLAYERGDIWEIHKTEKGVSSIINKGKKSHQ